MNKRPDKPFAIEQRFMPDWHTWARFESKERRDRALEALQANPPLLTQEFRAKDPTDDSQEAPPSPGRCSDSR